VGDYVVVELARRLSGELARSTPRSSEGRELNRILAEHDAVVLSPGAGVSDDSAFPFTTFEVPDMDRANSLAAALRALDGVESAYAKPGEALP
jgi:hypothetical protein